MALILPQFKDITKIVLKLIQWPPYWLLSTLLVFPMWLDINHYDGLCMFSLHAIYNFCLFVCLSMIVVRFWSH